MEELGNALVADRDQYKHHDVIGSLPLELVAQVLDYLDEVDIVRSQRVSKQWRAILSCDAISRSVLPRTLAALGMETTNVTASAATKYFQWLHNLQSGRPVKKVFLPFKALLPFPGKPMRPVTGRVAYHSRRLCYVIEGFSWDRVAMLNLETGKWSVWYNHAGGPTDGIALSDHYLFMFTWTRVISAVDIHTSQKWEGRKYPYRIERMAIEKNKLVILSQSNEGEPCSFWVWDLHTDRVREFGSLNPMDANFWHMEADENIMVAFAINWDEYPPLVQQTKWALTSGESLDRKTFPLSLGTSSRRVSRGEILRVRNHTFGRKTEVELHLKDGCTTMLMTYDYAVDRLSLRWINSAKPILDTINVPCESIPLTPHIYYRWTNAQKGVAVCNAAAFTGGTTATTIVHPYLLDEREFSLCDAWSDASADRPPYFAQYITIGVKSFGDREVYGVASDDGMQLWFFNPAFVPELPGLAESFCAVEETK